MANRLNFPAEVETIMARYGADPSSVSVVLDWGDGFPSFLVPGIVPAVMTDLAADLRAAHVRTGLWPLILGPQVGDVHGLHELATQAEWRVGTTAVVASVDVAITAWLPTYLDDTSLLFQHSDDEVGAALAVGGRFDAGVVLGGRWHEAISLLLVTCAAPWEVAARVGYGGWNDCPLPEAQAAFHRYLQDAAGLVVCGIDGENVLAHVDRPPVEPEQIISVVRVLQRYCNDLNLAADDIALARALRAGPAWWSFWWD